MDGLNLTQKGDKPQSEKAFTAEGAEEIINAHSSVLKTLYPA
jgi:hypothetical protein